VHLPVSLAFTDDTETGSDPSRLGDPNLICDTDIGDREVPDVWFIDNLERQHWGRFIDWAASLPDTIEWSLLPISSCARVGGRLPPSALGCIYSESAVVNSALAAGEPTISCVLATAARTSSYLELRSSWWSAAAECTWRHLEVFIPSLLLSILLLRLVSLPSAVFWQQRRGRPVGHTQEV
jgi:hypothetical protein